MNKFKKPALITLVVLDIAVTIFLFVISIMVLVATTSSESLGVAINKSTPLIKYFLQNPSVYLLTCVVPLFVILGINIVSLVLYVKNTTKKEPIKTSDLTEEQKEALKQELLKELQNK